MKNVACVTRSNIYNDYNVVDYSTEAYKIKYFENRPAT